MDDDAKPQRVRVVDNFLEEDILHTKKPMKSPDLGPIEHISDGLGRAIVHQLPPRILQALKAVIMEELDLLPQAFLDTHINNMTACS
ncbi:hypothetical protein TNCV_4076041 [Trichonephila clavipes]|nr:hypothetical protein TNCV_4076041 [Trichonephila clavipes]